MRNVYTIRTASPYVIPDRATIQPSLDYLMLLLGDYTEAHHVQGGIMMYSWRLDDKRITVHQNGSLTGLASMGIRYLCYPNIEKETEDIVGIFGSVIENKFIYSHSAGDLSCFFYEFPK